MTQGDSIPAPVEWSGTAFGLCDSPLVGIEKSMLDKNHPAFLFEEHWRFLKKEENLPLREDFRPADVVSMLKWIMILSNEPSKDGERYKFKLIGTAAEVLLHSNYTGKYLDEAAVGECLNSRLNMFAVTLADKEPKYGQAQLGLQSEFNTSVMVGLFPFAGRSCDANEIFAVVAPSQVEQRAFL